MHAAFLLAKLTLQRMSFHCDFIKAHCYVLLTMYVLLALQCLFQASDDCHMLIVPHTGSV